MNNISFQGRTNLIFDTQKYNKELAGRLAEYRNITNTSQQSMPGAIRFTSTADPENLLVIVRNENNGFIRLVKLNESCSKVIEDIAEKTEKLVQNSKEKLTAWIIGGDKSKGKLGDETIKRVNELAEFLCDRNDIETSILAGSGKQENIFVQNFKKELNITLDKPKNTNIENEFEIVELNNTEII